MNKYFLIDILEQYAARATVFLCAAVAVSLFLYGAFLLTAVQHTAARAAAERSINSATARLSVLEERYLTQTQWLTRERAAALGFVAPARVTTVFSNAQNTALTLREGYESR